MAESKIARKARLQAMRKKYGLGEFKSGSRATTARRRRSGTVAKHRKRKGRSHGGGSGMSLTSLGMSAGYGYFRKNIVSAAQPVIAYVPGGVYSDNLTIGGAAYILHKYVGGGPMVKQALTAIAQAEAYEAGKKFGGG